MKKRELRKILKQLLGTSYSIHFADNGTVITDIGGELCYLLSSYSPTHDVIRLRVAEMREWL